MSEQQKILRVLKLISLLKCDHGRTIMNLAEQLEVTERTIYRYLDLLAALGIDVDTTFTGNRKFIPDFEGTDLDVSFSIEESLLLRDLVLSGTNNEVLKSTILQKLYINSELGPISESLINGRINLLKTKLARAIQQEKQVILKSYHSLNSGEIKDYKVEPFHFTENYSSVIAYDVGAKMVKQFKLSRMSEVIMLDKGHVHLEEHQLKTTDAFNFTGDSSYHVKLKLSFQAYLLLREEYPKTIPYLIKDENGAYIFIGKVNHLYGIGRFVLGMLDEIVVVEPVELKEYIKEKLGDHQKLGEDRVLSKSSKINLKVAGDPDLFTE
jgi:proteasome accessory factor C